MKVYCRTTVYALVRSCLMAVTTTHATWRQFYQSGQFSKLVRVSNMYEEFYAVDVRA